MVVASLILGFLYRAITWAGHVPRLSTLSLFQQRQFLHSHQLSESRAPPTVPQFAHWQRGAQLLRALVVTAALPSQTCEFTLQFIDLTFWQSILLHTDLLAMVAAVYIYIKLRNTPEQRYLHNLPPLLEAVAVQLLRRRPNSAPALRDEHSRWEKHEGWAFN